jgi:hypothetical protein
VSWERGRTEIERLIADGELERVGPSDEVAARLVADATAHIALASKGIEDDPAGTLQLSYDAARKSSAALLAIQGLRRNRAPAARRRAPELQRARRHRHGGRDLNACG